MTMAGQESPLNNFSVLMDVRELINTALGPPQKNWVNFKIIQVILHMLARQLRMLDQKVEINLESLQETVGEERRRSGQPGGGGGRSASVSHERGGEATRESTRSSSAQPDKDRRTTKQSEEQNNENSPYKENTKETISTSKEHKQKGRKGDKNISDERKTDKDEQATSQEITATGKKLGEKVGRGTKGIHKSERGIDEEGIKNDDTKEIYMDEKGASKSRGKNEKNKEQGDRGGTTISLKEVERDKEKIIVVGKERIGKTFSDTQSRRSIDVATQSQFKLLERKVQELQEKAGPIPSPSLPDNKKLRDDIAKGNASLIDTMQAMQVSIRVEAAETAIGRVTELLTQLATSGVLPEDIAGKAININAEVEAATRESAQKAADASINAEDTTVSSKWKTIQSGANSTPPPTVVSTEVGRTTATSQTGTGTLTSAKIKLTHEMMNDALQDLRHNLTQHMTSMTAGATKSAEHAFNIAMATSKKIAVAERADKRMSELSELVADYSELLNGFQAGITTQLQSFQDLVALLRFDLTGGLDTFQQVKANFETAAVYELTGRYRDLVGDFNEALFNHQRLADHQRNLTHGIRGLAEVIESMQGSKADRDEVVDELRDKASVSQLSGLLDEKNLDILRRQLELHIDHCYLKFSRQEVVWTTALSDLHAFMAKKAEYGMLESVWEQMQAQLRELDGRMKILTAVLGEPKAALLTRKMATDATCGACRTPASMPAGERAGVPFLPALASGSRPRAPATDQDLCFMEILKFQQKDEKAHSCRRWCGGSHTLVSRSVAREHAPPALPSIPTAKYLGSGSDGHQYNLDDELLPCVECNRLSSDFAPVTKSVEKKSLSKNPGAAEKPEDGAGDQGARAVKVANDLDEPSSYKACGIRPVKEDRSSRSPAAIRGREPVTIAKDDKMH